MTKIAATTLKLASGGSISFSAKTALVIAALASASAALIANFDPINRDVPSASAKDILASPFNDRFVPGSASDLLSTDFPRPVVQSLSSELEIKL